MIPMFQIKPERSAIYYEHRLYPDADYFIISSSVRSRYEAEPDRFPVQNAFYDSLDKAYHQAKVIAPRGKGPGPVLTLYRNRGRQSPFGGRDDLRGPARLMTRKGGMASEEAFFCYNMGLNYAYFGFYDQALSSYREGFRYQPLRPDLHRNLSIEIVNVLLGRGEFDEALRFLDIAESTAPTEETRSLVEQLRRTTLAGRRP
jgi:tetratricopeptide (TPR) repeat protein